jgi:hypothetical protein
MYSEKIVVLSSSPLQENGQFANFENGLYLGGQVRMEAAAYLAERAVETEFILVGGYNKEGQGDPTTSDKVNDMAAFLMNKAPDANIRSIYSLPCTHHNFVAVFRDCLRRDAQGGDLGILTNEYHMPRALEFARQAAGAFNLQDRLRFVPVPAETVLGTTIESIVGDRLDEYTARVESEQRGLRQLQEGSYEDSCLTKNLDRLQYVIHHHADEVLTDAERRFVGIG